MDPHAKTSRRRWSFDDLSVNSKIVAAVVSAVVVAVIVGAYGLVALRDSSRSA